MKILSSRLAFLATGAAAILLAARAVFAIDTSQITFPITELGNCASVAECKTYCSQPVNYDACKAFAQDHRVKPDLDEAKNLLGCESLASCKTFCQQPANREKCTEFANRKSQAPVSPAIVALFFQATQQELGCSSVETCKTTCDQPANFQKCTQFAKRHNLFRPLPSANSATPSSDLKLIKPPSLTRPPTTTTLPTQ